MIFNESYGTNEHYDSMSFNKSFTESALEYVYENENNYNALIKAIGISEYRYFQDTGKDLLLTESGAFSAVIDKAKDFFKSIGEKIKALFNKFRAFIGSKLGDDKKFVDKYGDKIKDVDITNFETKGYKFTALDTALSATDFKINDLKGADDPEAGKFRTGSSDIDDKESDVNRAVLYGILTGESATELSTGEFTKKLKSALVGDAVTLKKADIAKDKLLDDIKTAKSDITKVNNLEKTSTHAIQGMIKELERYKKSIDKDNDDREGKIKAVNKNIKIFKDYASAITAGCGAVIDAVKKRRGQSKAICIKIATYKGSDDKQATGESYYNLFANVVIN